MAELISEIREILQEPTIQYEVQELWGSEHANHREQIQSALKQQGNVLDSSISHTQALGGFAWILNSTGVNKQIGFDIEVSKRVTLAVARRVCHTEEEFHQAPSPAHLWTAKEAIFKALKGVRQPNVVLNLEISDWRQYKPTLWVFCLKNKQSFDCREAKGVVFTTATYAISCAIVNF